jgi:tetratricopeptide (TPR) repeat protein
MPAKSANNPKVEETVGFAAFLDLHDSTFAWNQNATLARSVIAMLAKTVQDACAKSQMQIGNFTGDGFLLLFEGTDAGLPVRALAAIIESWEVHRKEMLGQFKSEKVAFPDKSALKLRAAVSFGRYYAVDVVKGRADFAGEAINLAQRCFVAAKPYFEKSGTQWKKFKQGQCVFITQNCENLVDPKADFIWSEQLLVTFPGYKEQASEKNLRKEAGQFIIGLWPRTTKASSPPRPSALPPANLARAAGYVETGNRLFDVAQGTAGSARRALIEQSVAAYREALRVYTYEAMPADYAMTQNNLGNALGDQADLLEGAPRREKLDAAIAAYREALRIHTYEAMPVQYAGTQNNLGTALRDQAALLEGAPQREKLNDAVAAFREALRVFTYEAMPAYYAMTQNNLGTALGDQAALLEGAPKQEKLEAAVAAFREALRVFTYEAMPVQYAGTQNNLGNALGDQAALLEGAPKQEKLDDAVAAFSEALRIRTYEAMPTDYAMTQNNLGATLCDQAALLEGTPRREKLDAAVAAYREALRVYTAEHFPYQHRRVTENLRKAEQAQR